MQSDHFTLADRCCLSYLAASALVLALADGLTHLPRLALYAAAIAGILGFATLAPATRARRPWRLLDVLYPIAVVAITWGELKLLIPAVWGDRYWATDWAVRADLALFGDHPTATIQALHTPWLDELMAAVDISYYLFLAVPLILLLLGRHDAARATAGVIALTYTVNFALFVLLPVKSPPQILDRYPELLPGSFGGWVVADALRALQSSESVTGAAFPSSHVAGSVACALAARRWAPPLGVILLPLAAGVAFATVYLGYHHAIDPIAGIVWGGLAWWLAAAWMRRRGRLPEPQETA